MTGAVKRFSAGCSPHAFHVAADALQGDNAAVGLVNRVHRAAQGNADRIVARFVNPFCSGRQVGSLPVGRRIASGVEGPGEEGDEPAAEQVLRKVLLVIRE